MNVRLHKGNLRCPLQTVPLAIALMSSLLCCVEAKKLKILKSKTEFWDQRKPHLTTILEISNQIVIFCQNNLNSSEPCQGSPAPYNSLSLAFQSPRNKSVYSLDSTVDNSSHKLIMNFSETTAKAFRRDRISSILCACCDSNTGKCSKKWTSEPFQLTYLCPFGDCQAYCSAEKAEAGDICTVSEDIGSSKLDSKCTSAKDWTSLTQLPPTYDICTSTGRLSHGSALTTGESLFWIITSDANKDNTTCTEYGISQNCSAHVGLGRSYTISKANPEPFQFLSGSCPDVNCYLLTGASTAVLLNPSNESIWTIEASLLKKNDTYKVYCEITTTESYFYFHVSPDCTLPTRPSSATITSTTMTKITTSVFNTTTTTTHIPTKTVKTTSEGRTTVTTSLTPRTKTTSGPGVKLTTAASKPLPTTPVIISFADTTANVMDNATALATAAAPKKSKSPVVYILVAISIVLLVAVITITVVCTVQKKKAKRAKAERTAQFQPVAAALHSRKDDDSFVCKPAFNEAAEVSEDKYSTQKSTDRNEMGFFNDEGVTKTRSVTRSQSRSHNTPSPPSGLIPRTRTTSFSAHDVPQTSGDERATPSESPGFRVIMVDDGHSYEEIVFDVTPATTAQPAPPPVLVIDENASALS